MTHTISYTFVAGVNNGPSISASGTLSVDVYSVVQVTVPAAGSTVADISPDAEGQLLVITSESYDDMTYQVTSGVLATLDGPHILLGAGAVGLLRGGDPVETITFQNGGTEDVDVTVVLGRAAA